VTCRIQIYVWVIGSASGTWWVVSGRSLAPLTPHHCPPAKDFAGCGQYSSVGRSHWG